jgi:hypothetical protein
MRSRRGLLFVSLLCALGLASCLFSTTPPETKQPDTGTPPPPADVAAVGGSVQFYDRTDHHYQVAPGRMIFVKWFIPDPQVSGGLKLLIRTQAAANRSAAYRAEYRDSRIRAAEVFSYLCEYNPADIPDCCLDEVPCRECPTQIYTTVRRVNVLPGQFVQQDVIVPCDHAP